MAATSPAAISSLSLTADGGCRDLPEPPRLNGIEVALEWRASDGARLVLTLQDLEHFDIFRALCGHLLQATAGLARDANASGLRLVLRRLADWHEMLRRGRDDLLGVPERIGLAGELLFLRDVILPRLSLVDAAASWRGGHRDEQDFAVGHWQFEIKTQLSTADQRLIIASEAQLDTAESQLLLCHQGVAASPPAAAFTLNSLVASLALDFEAGGPSAKDVFDAGLDAWGYVWHEDYDQPAWVLTDRRLFEVREGFPRIVPAMLPPGVQKVSYEVLLRDCEPFAVDFGQTMSRVFAWARSTWMRRLSASGPNCCSRPRPRATRRPLPSSISTPSWRQRTATPLTSPTRRCGTKGAAAISSTATPSTPSAETSTSPFPTSGPAAISKPSTQRRLTPNSSASGDSASRPSSRPSSTPSRRPVRRSKRRG